MSECADCRRLLPDSEPLYGGRCRICAKMPKWREKGAAATPAIDPGACPSCKTRKRIWHESYCLPCRRKKNRLYAKAFRERQKKARKIAVVNPAHQPIAVHNFPVRSQPLVATKEFPGVDIDKIHRNPRWMKKVKRAA